VSDPKHFRELLPIKPKRQPKKVLPPKPGLVLTPEYVAQQEDKKRAMVAFANTLRCFCSSQLDGGAFPDRASLYCRADPDHFTCEYDTHKVLRSQVFRLSFNECGYTIQAMMHDAETADITVFIIDRTVGYEMQEKYRTEMFRYTGCLPEITSTISEQDLVESLKLMALFS
jgi:hypothetical protein